MSKTRGLVLETWPLLDQQMLHAAMQGGSRRSDQWHATRLASTTVATLLSNYGSSLKWLSKRSAGWGDSPPLERWPPDVLNAMIDEISPRYAAASVVSRVRSLKKMLSLMTPGADLEHFDIAIGRLGC